MRLELYVTGNVIIFTLPQVPVWALEGTLEETRAPETNLHVDTFALHPNCEFLFHARMAKVKKRNLWWQDRGRRVCSWARGHRGYAGTHVCSPEHADGNIHSLSPEATECR